MKIKKYPQSCLLVETNNKKILIDPGTLKYCEKYFEEWNNVNIILITHKHVDHCNFEVLKNIKKEIKIYSTQEVKSNYKELEIEIIKEEDVINLENIKIEIVKAIHGYQPMLKNGKEVFENVGYIIDDGQNRLYATSDTICFNNNYKADILCAPVTGHGLTMSAFETALYTKEVEAKILLPIHMDNETFKTDINYMKEIFNKYEIEYELLENEETIEIE